MRSMRDVIPSRDFLHLASVRDGRQIVAIARSHMRHVDAKTRSGFPSRAAISPSLPKNLRTGSLSSGIRHSWMLRAKDPQRIGTIRMSGP